MPSHEEARTARHRVVVIGSGFGGLFGTQALKRADVDITLVARTTHHLFQPLLYQVATGILSEGEIAPTTREVLARQQNARVVLGTVTHVDLAAKTVTSRVLDRETVTPYDTLLVAAGAGQSYFGNDQFAQYAPGMKSIDDALELRGRIFGAFEWAELASTPKEIERLMTFVVVGAGPTGVEMAGQIAELSHRTLQARLPKDRHEPGPHHPARRRPERARRVRRAPRGQGRRQAQADRRRGPARRQGRRTSTRPASRSRTPTASTAGSSRSARSGPPGSRPPSSERSWPSSPAPRSTAPGACSVNDDLTLPGHPEVFVVGDMASLKGYPGVAQVAIQGARYAAEQIKRRLAGQEPKGPFEYHDKGSMATISRFSAVASDRPAALLGLHRLGAVAGDPPRLHHRLQAPADHAAALGGQLRRPGPLRAHRHRAAGLRAQRDRPAGGGLRALPAHGWPPTGRAPRARWPRRGTRRRAPSDGRSAAPGEPVA